MADDELLEIGHWRCPVCGREHPTEDEMQACEYSHDGGYTGLAPDDVFAPLTRTEEHVVDALAVALLDNEEQDYLDLYRAAILRLAQAMEICPIHICDPQICADDGVTECQGVR